MIKWMSILKMALSKAVKYCVLANASREAGAPWRDCDRTPKITRIWGLLNLTASSASSSTTPNFSTLNTYLHSLCGLPGSCRLPCP